MCVHHKWLFETSCLFGFFWGVFYQQLHTMAKTEHSWECEYKFYHFYLDTTSHYLVNVSSHNSFTVKSLNSFVLQFVQSCNKLPYLLKICV